MNIKQLNQLPITDFLSKIGIEPSYKRSENQWYVSPIREPEHSPSFKVNTAINRWYDYALMQGGKLFDLAERLYPNHDASSLVEKLNSLFLFEQQNQDHCLTAKPVWQSVTEKPVDAPAIGEFGRVDHMIPGQIDHQQTFTRHIINNYQSVTYTGQFQPKRPALNFRIGVISGSEFSSISRKR